MIPGTFVDDSTKSIRWHRRPDIQADRVYEATVKDGHLRAILSCDPCSANGIIRKLWHLSVSHVNGNFEPDRTPTWDELKIAKYQLVPEDVAMVVILPRRTAPYVNSHPTVLHVWESTDKDIDMN